MKGKKLTVIFLLVFTILLTSFSFYAYQTIYSPNLQVGKEDRILIVKRGETFKSLQKKLYDDDYVQDLVSFSFLAKLMDYDKSIKPGRYLIKADMNNITAIRLLRIGQQKPVNITFNNIRLKEDIGKKITKRILLEEEDFNKSLLEFIATNDEGWNNENVIGMFIPNTYEVYFDISAEALIAKMNKEYEKFWNEDRLEKAKALSMDPRQVATLASIVQAESIKKEEGKTIAGLYINRLKRGIALQADPTLVFASGDFGLKRVLNEHKEIESPYNTYKYAGLPPGPINMPMIHSLDAVLNYEEHNFLYMCAKEDFSGYHNFAASLQQHLRNAKKYQTALTIEQRKARLNR